MPAGYSGTPLAKKLGIGEGAVVTLLNEPPGFRSLLDPMPADVRFKTSLRGGADVVVLFTIERSEFQRRIGAAGRTIFPAGGLWIGWPKKASNVPTDMTEDVVREVALPLGLVDNKVCAIDDVWSGLRIVWRRELRG
ncbi:MAG: hypothetical protein ACI81L_002439 [Verrucomicrobiales bacterium]|jgi:hypothetical protein